jgi:hypothetical protein
LSYTQCSAFHLPIHLWRLCILEQEEPSAWHLSREISFCVCLFSSSVSWLWVFIEIHPRTNLASAGLHVAYMQPWACLAQCLMSPRRAIVMYVLGQWYRELTTRFRWVISKTNFSCLGLASCSSRAVLQPWAHLI